MSRYTSYPEYRDSGVGWLGNVPQHWDITPFKFVVRFINGAAFKPAEWSDDGVPIIRIENLNGGGNFNFFDGEVDQRYHVSYGDLLFGWSGNRGTSFGPFLWEREGRHYLNQHIFRLEGFSAHKRWLYWTLKAVTKTIEDEAHGIIGMVHVTKGKLGNVKIPAIEHIEQEHIAEFLDHEIARIDALIEKKQRLIELLKEKRQAVITQAVTKGLDPNVPMKDSGVEWLGEVPEHWVCRSLGTLANVVRGASPRPAGDPQYFEGDFLPWVTVAEITKDNRMYLDETASYLTQEGTLHSRVFRAGTLLYSNSGATLGVPKITNIDACANDGVVGFESLSVEVDIRFLYYFLSSLTTDLRERIKQGAGQPNLNTEIVRGLKVALPPIGEQQELITSVELHLARFSVLMEKATRSVDLLMEHRSALITAAVTGQIDVRDAA